MTIDIFTLGTQPWMTDPRRNCADTDYPDAWFDERLATSLCGGCPLQLKCLTYALDFIDPVTGRRVEGVWGGTTTEQRAEARRPKTPCGTPAGFAAHKAAGEPTCPPCRGAHASVSAAAERRRKRAVA